MPVPAKTKEGGETMTAEEQISSVVKDVETLLKEVREQKDVTDQKVKDLVAAREKELLELKNELETMRKAQAEFERKVKLPGSEEAAKDFSIIKAAWASWTGDWRGAEKERELVNETHKAFNRDQVKDITAGSGAAGGFLLPVVVAGEIIPLALAETPVLSKMGITRITGIGAGEYRLSKQTARASAQWVGENVAPASSSATFDQRILRMRKVAAVTFVSNDMARQGRSDMEAFARQDLADALALKLEEALIFGKGTDHTPKGLISSTTNAANYSGFSTVAAMGANGGQYGFVSAAKQVNAIRKANLLKGNLGYLFHPDVLYGLQITRAMTHSGQTADGIPLVPGAPLLTDEELTKILRGYKWATTTLVPASATKGSGSSLAPTLFGDWSQLVLGLWSGLEISTAREATVNGTNAWAQDGFFVKALQGADVTMRDEAAFCVIPDCATTSLDQFPGDT